MWLTGLQLPTAGVFNQLVEHDSRFACCIVLYQLRRCLSQQHALVI
jgi:hypothetical protein